MSVFSNIMRKIFPSSHPAVAASTQGGAASNNTDQNTSQNNQNTSQSARAPFSASQPVDVEAKLTALATNNPQKLNWRTSIVDLLKLLDLDSSIAARKSLAQELRYTGDMNDSATMNIWLHKQVMMKLSENGGTVPEDLKH